MGCSSCNQSKTKIMKQVVPILPTIASRVIIYEPSGKAQPNSLIIHQKSIDTIHVKPYDIKTYEAFNAMNKHDEWNILSIAD